jgi:hypothetical protein
LPIVLRLDGPFEFADRFPDSQFELLDHAIGTLEQLAAADQLANASIQPGKLLAGIGSLCDALGDVRPLGLGYRRTPLELRDDVSAPLFELLHAYGGRGERLVERRADSRFQYRELLADLAQFDETCRDLLRLTLGDGSVPLELCAGLGPRAPRVAALSPL